jgi:hypothetical protein
MAKMELHPDFKVFLRLLNSYDVRQHAPSQLMDTPRKRREDEI